MVKLYIEKAKDRHIAKELVLLRASNPSPPMVSHLDEVDDAVIEEGIRRAVEARSQAASSVASCDDGTPNVHLPSASMASCDDGTPNVHPPSASMASCDDCTPNVHPPSASMASCDDGTPNVQPPSASMASCDDGTPNVQPPSASMASCDDGTPNVQPPSPTDNKVPCDTTMASPNEANPATTPYRSPMLQKRLPVLRKPASGCKNCQVLFAELNVVKKLLECEIERNHELKRLHSSTKRTNTLQPQTLTFCSWRTMVESVSDIEKRPENRVKLKLFFGLLGGYIAAITGHRKGVVINMTTEEVETAEKTKEGARIIRRMTQQRSRSGAER
ncbi:uncharacterized protein AKAME5_002453300 [Lates japonicus]|uniref:Uncharacterized protein n=1 Tax=Lates japonicus TaxID=270547 RepID=A0AAD3NIK8_LATJO|nr:uncharacterized protein AKAME5_002453300 [Lates japonicus]